VKIRPAAGCDPAEVLSVRANGLLRRLHLALAGQVLEVLLRGDA